MQIKRLKYSTEELEEVIEEVLNLKGEVESELNVDENEKSEG